MTTLLLLARSIRHTKPTQLASRLDLTVRRRQHTLFSGYYQRHTAVAVTCAVTLADQLPRPVFPPRNGLVSEHPGGFTFNLLNDSRYFGLPINWHPPGLDHGTGLWSLTLHYMEYLEGVSDTAFQTLVEDWIRNNPPYQARYWRADWNSYALSIRCVVWMQQLAIRGSRLSGSFVDRVCRSLIQQLRFLQNNLERDIGGNHLIKNIKALLWAGKFFDMEESDRWLALGSSLLRREIEEQILPDGFHYERSPAYHNQVFADLVECYSIMDAGDLKVRLRQVLSAMATVTADMMHPDGTCSLFNDGGLHMAYSPTACLEAWQASGGVTVRPAGSFSHWDSGYFGLRSGDELFVADCGAIGPDHLPAHGHGDILSFEWSVGGKRLVIDTGVFEYNAGPRREHARSTRAHNTVTLDGLDQCEFWSAFRVARRASAHVETFRQWPAGMGLTGWHTGYRHLPGKPVHYRTFEVQPGKVAVDDSIIAGNGQKVEARLLFHPECDISQTKDATIIRNGEVRVRLATTHPFEVEKACWYPDFGVQQQCLQLVLQYGSAPCSGSFMLERLS